MTLRVSRPTLYDNWRHLQVVGAVVRRSFLLASPSVDAHDDDNGDNDDEQKAKSDRESDDQRQIHISRVVADTAVQERPRVADMHLHVAHARIHMGEFSEIQLND